MRIGFFSSMLALLAGMGTALAQAPSTPATPPASSPAVKVPPAAPDSGALHGYGEGTTLPGSVADAPAVDGPGCGADCGSCSPYRFYGSIEYLLWKMKDAPIPPTQLTLPVVTTGINQETTSVTLGNGAGIDYGGRSGVRAFLGYWFDADHTCGLEVGYFQFERRDSSVLTSQQANLQLNVQVIQNITTTTIVNGAVVTSITQTPVNVALPSTLTFVASGSAGPTNFWGGEVNARSTRCYFGGLSIDVLGGFRYMDLDEEFLLNQTITLQAANPNTIFVNGAVGTTGVGLPTIPPALTGLHTITSTTSLNNIATHNNFYGAQAGLSYNWCLFPRLALEGWGKLGVGAMVEEWQITSSTVTSGANGTAASPGGVLPAVSTFDQGRTKYAVMPELNITLAYALTQHIRATIGYNFLYISSVIRPGDQLVFNSSATQINIAGTQNNISTFQPSFVFKDTDFWAMGLNAGIEIKY